MKKLYIVTAYKNGDQESHSYPIGVFDNLDLAIVEAESHADFRGGKYGCVVDECQLNHYRNEDDNHTKEVYRAKSRYEFRLDKMLEQ